MKKILMLLFLSLILFSCEVKTTQNSNSIQKNFGDPFKVKRESENVPFYVDVFTYKTDGMKYVVFTNQKGGMFVVNVTKDLNSIK